MLNAQDKRPIHPISRLALLEVAAFYGVIFTAIWGGQRLTFKPSLWVGAVGLIAGAVYSNRKHGDSRERIGLGKQWLRPASKLTLKAAGPIIGVLALWAVLLPAPTWPKIIFGVLGYPLWAFAQQYALMSFSANRLVDGLGNRPWLVSFLNGGLFAMVHFPNPMLMAACLVSGVVFTRIFLKTPHLIPIALAHAAGGFLLSWITLHQYNAMMVGPAYWKHALTLGPHP